LVARQTNVELDRARPLIQAIQMIVKRDNLSVNQTDSFPDTIAKDKAGIENRNFRLVPFKELTVDEDHDAVVAVIIDVALRAGFTCGKRRHSEDFLDIPLQA
jgi:hypothetical protein